MKLVYFLPILIAFVLTPAFAYNSGFRPIYQPNSGAGGSNATELYCTFGEFLNSYNSTTNSFTCGAGGGGGENNTASNLSPGTGLFFAKSGVDLEFKSLTNGSNITISANDTTVMISASGSAGEANTMSSPTHANTLVLTKVGVDLPIKGVAVSGDLQISSNDTDVTISFTDTPGGSGFDTIASSPQTTATILADNSTITNTATIKTLTQGTGITLTNGSNAVTVATSFKANTLACSGTDKFSAYDNSTGLYTCTADSSGATAREDLVSQYEVDRTWTNIGVNYVDVYSTAEGIRIDTNGMTTATFQILWTKVGAGTQRCQIVDITDATKILIVLNGVASGTNTNATQTIPAALLNTIATYEPQCMSTTSTDDPVWLSASVLLRP